MQMQQFRINSGKKLNYYFNDRVKTKESEVKEEIQARDAMIEESSEKIEDIL